VAKEDEEKARRILEEAEIL